MKYGSNLRSVGRKLKLNLVNPFPQVLLAADVRFEDASQPAATRLPVPPSFSVRLPHDFFYPFRLISSPAVGLRSSFSTILLGLVCFHLTFRE